MSTQAGSHTTSVVQRFLADAGESGFIWAREAGVRPPSYYYLKHGEAKEMRAYTKAQLECPADVCGNRRLTTVRQERAGRRDHFRHFVKTVHSGEGLNHIQAKAVLLQWLATAYPLVVADEEMRTEDRIADIFVSNPNTGNRMAIEVQYSPLANWHQRHSSYANMAVVDQWIFGSQGRQAKRRHDETLRLTAPQRALARERLPLLWINPQTEEVATGYVLKDGLPAVPGALSDWVYLKVEPLNQCRLTAVGIRTDTTRELGIAEAEYEEAPFKAAEWARLAGAPQLVERHLGEGLRRANVPEREVPYLIHALRTTGPEHVSGRSALRRLRELGVTDYLRANPATPLEQTGLD